jgi:hypothetical protein
MKRLRENIWDSPGKFTAEHWGFWMTWLAPYLLEGRLPNEHYRHMCLFSSIIKSATSLEIIEVELTKLEADIKQSHADYAR